MIKQLARSIEMVVLKQLSLMTGEKAKSSGLNIKYEDEKLIEMWFGILYDKQFKITIEEIV